MGYGQGPYGCTPFGTAPDSPSEEPPTVLNSSRSIDGKFKRYDVDSDGNNEGMDDVAQRVMLLSSYALNDSTDLIGLDFESRRDDAVRTALSVMTTGRQPAIRIDQIETVNFAPGQLGTRVVYTNLLTNTKTSVDL